MRCCFIFFVFQSTAHVIQLYCKVPVSYNTVGEVKEAIPVTFVVDKGNLLPLQCLLGFVFLTFF
jgi:hypothetical protein